MVLRYSRGMTAPLDPTNLVERWLCAPKGRALLQAHQRQSVVMLERVFGDVAIQVGTFGPTDWFLRHARLPHRVLMAEAGGLGDLQCHAEVLALSDRSVDLLLLPHTLEFADDPLSVLREAERVLNLGGHLWLAGMDPWGLFYWGSKLHWHAPLPEQRQVLSLFELKRWLNVLGLTVVRVQRFGLDGTGYRWLNPRASFYQLLVVKKVHSLTPIRPRRHRMQSALGSLAAPQVRSQFESE
jgi:SAM-dependent methyltransferase